MLQGLRKNIHRVSERTHEIAYGIRTAGWVSEEDLGYSRGDGRVHYTPIPYTALKGLLSAIVPNPQRDVFIDWGCGLGRAVVLAAAQPYREVIGVEYSADLCAAAEKNLERTHSRRKCGSVRIVNSDALKFPIPGDASVMFLFNPFQGELLTGVVRHIRDSWIAYPRPITFLVANHASFVVDTGSTDWLADRSSWAVYPGTSCRVIRSV